MSRPTRPTSSSGNHLGRRRPHGPGPHGGPGGYPGGAPGPGSAPGPGGGGGGASGAGAAAAAGSVGGGVAAGRTGSVGVSSAMRQGSVGKIRDGCEKLCP